MGNRLAMICPMLSDYCWQNTTPLCAAGDVLSVTFEPGVVQYRLAAE
ncbi:MAG: hypothetical protein ACP5XB_10785 [Isosphaeraceae bacterium]